MTWQPSPQPRPLVLDALVATVLTIAARGYHAYLTARSALAAIAATATRPKPSWRASGTPTPSPATSSTRAGDAQH